MLPSNDGHAADGPGTRWGFILPTWQTARHYAGYNDMTAATFLTQTQAEMGDLAEVYFWDRLSADEMAAGVDASVIDWCWTSGGAITDIQRELGVGDDGVIGPLTLAAIAGEPTFIADVCEWRMAYYDECGFRAEYPGLYTRAVAIRNLATVWAGP
jgi:lysozyme family protein